MGSFEGNKKLIFSVGNSSYIYGMHPTGYIYKVVTNFKVKWNVFFSDFMQSDGLLADLGQNIRLGLFCY